MTVALQHGVANAPLPLRSPPVSPDSFANLRVLVAHDWLVTWGGAERCTEEILSIFPNADLVVGVRSEAMRDFNEVSRRARETWLAHVPGARKHHRWFLPLHAPAFASVDTSRYDLVISSSHAFAKVVRRRTGAIHVCYCHSPPRYLWDLNETYRRQMRGVRGLALASVTGMLRRVDRLAAGSVDHFICNTRYIADRVRRCYGRDADVVYPPVAQKPLRGPAPKRGDFLLSLGRLVPYKRVDLAVQVAERLGIRLVVAGDGPERSRLQEMAGRHTEFVGSVSEEEAGQLLSTCAAFVFCAEEDFGIAPVEANAHGAPVVGFGRGGLLETMREHLTAEFFSEQTVDAVANAVQRALGRRWREEQLRANAALFSPESFRQGITRSIGAALAARAI